MKLSRRALLASAAIGLLPFEKVSGWTHGKPTGLTSFTIGPVGGGGFITSLDMASDGSTKVLMNDTYGAWFWNTSASLAQWAQIIDASRLVNNPYVLGGLATGPVDVMNGYSVRIAPSDPQTMYAIFPTPSGTAVSAIYTGSLWKSTNGGQSWTITATTGISISSAGPKRLSGQKMAIDPANKNVVYWGDDAGVVHRTLDGGATSATVSNVLAGAPCIATDPTSGTTTVGGVIVTKGVYIGAFAGTPTAVYESLDGAATFNATTGGPTNVQHMVISNDGVLVAIAPGVSATNSWRYVTPTSTSGLTASTWLNFSLATNGLVAPTASNVWQSAAFDPANPGHLVLLNTAGQLATSSNYGTAFFTWQPSGAPARASYTDTTIPWLSYTNNISLTAGNIMFDPSGTNLLVFTFGTGCGTVNPTFGNTTLGPAYQGDTFNQNGLIVCDIMKPPGGGPLNLFCQDRVQVQCPSLTTFPTTNFFPLGATKAIAHSLSGDYSKTDPTFLMLGCSDTLIYKSTDSGASWAVTAANPPSNAFPIVAVGFGTGNGANAICAGVTGALQYTTDGGQTWTAATTNAGSLATWGTGLGGQKVLVADDTTSGVFYARSTTGFYKSTDGGATYTQMCVSGAANYSNKTGLFSTLKQVPGNTNHLFFANGLYTTAVAHPQTGYTLQRTADGGATWTTVASVDEAWQVCFGKAKPGNTLPSIYFSGYLHNDPLGTVPGIFRCDNLTLNPSDPMTWTRIATTPNGIMDKLNCMFADVDTYGTIYIGNHGYQYGKLT